jgi:hypothetical protein
LPLPENAPFKLWIAPERVTYAAGVCRYNPVAIPIRPGLHNIPADGSAATMDALQRDKLGRVEVPGDFELIAWGEKQRGYLMEMEIGSDPNGKPLYHYHSAWTRYQKLGASYVQEFDSEGWADFCTRVEKLMGGPPNAQIAAAEKARRQALIAQHQRQQHVSPASLSNIVALEASLTPAPAA